MNRTGDPLTFIGLGTAGILALLPQVLEDVPEELIYAAIAIFAVVVFYGLWRSGYLLAIPLPIKVKRLLYPGLYDISSTEKYGLVVTARLRWEDSVGKPLVSVDDGVVTGIWAALDIEVRNLDDTPKRISEIFLEVKAARFPWPVIGTADPVAIDQDDNWHKKKFPRRVEWRLEPVSQACTWHVRFHRGWSRGEPAPSDPKYFSAVLIARLGSAHRQIRVELGEDIIGRE